MSNGIRGVEFGNLGVALDERPDGTLMLRSTEVLPAFPPHLTDRLVHWATVAPTRTFLAKRVAGGDWRRLSYSDTWSSVQQVATALCNRRLDPSRPIVILSGNDI